MNSPFLYASPVNEDVERPVSVDHVDRGLAACDVYRVNHTAAEELHDVENVEVSELHEE